MLSVVNRSNSNLTSYKFTWLNGKVTVFVENENIVSWECYYHNGNLITDPYRLSRMKQGVSRWSKFTGLVRNLTL